MHRKILLSTIVLIAVTIFGVSSKQALAAPPTPIISASPSCTLIDTSNMYTISWASTSPAVTVANISTTSNFATFYNKGISGTSTTASAGFGNGVSGWYWNGSSWVASTLVLQPNTTYYVYTWDGSATSATASFTTPSSCVPLPAPQNLTYTCGSGGTSVTLSWNAISGAGSYQIRINKDPQGDWVGPGDLVPTSVLPATTQTITTGANYTWSVQGIRAGEVYPYAGAIGSGPAFNCPPPAPTGLTASCPAPGTTANLSWSGNNSATTYYEMYIDNQANVWGTYSTGNDSASQINSPTNTFNSTTFAGATYGWWMRACNSGSCSSVTYAPSSFSCTPPACNATISCSGACSPNANTCSANNGTKNGCTYTTYSGGGSCTQTAAPNQVCTQSNCSSGYSCISGTCIAPPPAPTGLTATCNAPGTAAGFSWSGNNSATTYYEMYIDNQANVWGTYSTGNDSASQINSPTNTFNSTTFAGATYGWWMRACNSAGCSSVTYAPSSFSCTPPACNATISCSGACSPNANTCSANNGTKNGCTYTTYSGGGSCTQTAAPNQACTQSNCSAGYSCSGSTCNPVPPPTSTISASPSCTPADTSSMYTISWTSTSPAVSVANISTTSNFATFYNKGVSGTSVTASTGFNGWSGVSGPLILQPNTTYYVDTWNGIALSGTASFTTPNSCMTSAPTGLTASCPSPGSTGTMSWGAVSGATFYSVYAQTTDHIFNWATACTAPNFCDHHLAPSTSISFTTVPGQNYQWYVSAGNSVSESTVNGATFSCTAPTPPPAPTGLSVSCQAPGTTANFSWSGNNSATSYYEMYIDNQANVWGTYSAGNDSADQITSPTNTFNSPTFAGATYGWWMRACNSGGCSSVTYAPSSFSCTPPITNNNLPIGWETYGIAGYSDTCVNIKGWACDLDSKNTQLQVHLYKDGVYSEQLAANAYPDSTVNTQCGGSTVDHGYSWTIPTSLKDGTNHTVTVYGINVNSIGETVGSGNSALSGAPVTINCILPPPAPTISPSPACTKEDTSNMYNISLGASTPAITYVDISTFDLSTATATTPYYNKAVTGSTTITTATLATTGFGTNGGYWNGTAWSSSTLVLQPSTTYYVRTYNGLNSLTNGTFTTNARCPCDSVPSCTGCTAALPNTCAPGVGTGTGCQNTKYSGDINGGTTCTPAPANDQPNSCTQACSADRTCSNSPLYTCDLTLTPAQRRIYRITGDFTVNSDITLNAPGVVFVDKNLYINTDLINNNPKTGLIFVVKGSIYINRNVERVDAYLISHGKDANNGDITPFCSAWVVTAEGPACDINSDSDTATQKYLTINGAVISLNSSIAPQFYRQKFDAISKDKPAETINFEPKYLVILKDIFSRDLKIWREIQ